MNLVYGQPTSRFLWSPVTAKSRLQIANSLIDADYSSKVGIAEVMYWDE